MEKPLTMQELPLADRPYEKMEMVGAEALSEAELLAIILCSGYQGTSSLSLAQQLLVRYPSLADLADVDLEEFTHFRGIGRIKALRLKAAFEIGRRVQFPHPQEAHPRINSSQAAIAFMEASLSQKPREEFHVLLLDVKGRLIRCVQMALGGLNTANIFPRDIFREAVRANAAGMILCHNHPSGDPSPSEQDLLSTKNLQALGNQMGIKVLDHIIIARRGSVSLKALELM